MGSDHARSRADCRWPSSARSIIVPCMELSLWSGPRIVQGRGWPDYIPLRASRQGRVYTFSASLPRDMVVLNKPRFCARTRGRPEAKTMIPNAQRMFNFELGETAD